MTKRQRINKQDQLRTALEILFQNTVQDTAKVRCFDTVPSRFWYKVVCSKKQPFNSQAIATEIEKVFPNMRVVTQFVFFFSRSITFIGKELGKKGTYEFIVEQVSS